MFSLRCVIRNFTDNLKIFRLVRSPAPVVSLCSTCSELLPRLSVFIKMQCASENCRNVATLLHTTLSGRVWCNVFDDVHKAEQVFHEYAARFRGSVEHYKPELAAFDYVGVVMCQKHNPRFIFEASGAGFWMECCEPECKNSQLHKVEDPEFAELPKYIAEVGMAFERKYREFVRTKFMRLYEDLSMQMPHIRELLCVNVSFEYTRYYKDCEDWRCDIIREKDVSSYVLLEKLLDPECWGIRLQDVFCDGCTAKQLQELEEWMLQSEIEREIEREIEEEIEREIEGEIE